MTDRDSRDRKQRGTSRIVRQTGTDRRQTDRRQTGKKTDRQTGTGVIEDRQGLA